MNRIVRNIPNTITCGNLLCGCLAIVKAFEGDLVWAAYLVGIAAVLDFFDGFAARALKVSSPIGKDLDSLADMVTFGVVPGVVMYVLIEWAITNFGGFHHEDVWPENYRILTFAGFLIPIFSAIRLARFNNDARQTESFIGLPTPANAIFVCSLPLILFKQYHISNFPEIETCHEDYDIYQVLNILASPLVLTIIACLFSLLLVVPLPLFSLKFKSFGWKGNEIRFTFLILSVTLIAVFQFIGIPLVIVLYILMSIINNLVNRPSKG